MAFHGVRQALGTISGRLFACGVSWIFSIHLFAGVASICIGEHQVVRVSHEWERIVAQFILLLSTILALAITLKLSELG
jgi:succinate dehydrogenase/fumarate reductase cytochrome b subunit